MSLGTNGTEQLREAAQREHDRGNRSTSMLLLLAANEIEQLAAKQQHAAVEEKYQELLYAVGNKYPNETRHETALRYIRGAEQHAAMVPDECAATGMSCSYTPHGLNKEMQCEYCGAAPTPSATESTIERNWKFVEQAYDSSSTGRCERLLFELGLPESDAAMPLSWHLERFLTSFTPPAQEG